MSAPRLVARYFTHGPHGKFQRLAGVLEKSVRHHCPGWTVDISAIPFEPMASPRGSDHNCYNTQKLEAWATIVNAAADGDRLLLVDADMVVLQPLADLWDANFDLAYTVKPKGSRMPFNAGVIAVRVTPATRAFLRTWAEADRYLFDHPLEQDVWLPAFGGMNQCSLGMLLSVNDQAKPEPYRGLGTGMVALRKLPCAVWNCEDESWPSFSSETRVAHLKGELRREVLGERLTTKALRLIVEAWWRMEALPEHAEIPHRQPIDTDDRMIRPGDLQTVDPPPLTTPESPVPDVTIRKNVDRKRRRKSQPSSSADSAAP